MSLLDKLTGGVGGEDKPIQVVMTHDLAPLHEPVVKGALVVIAACLILLLVERASRKSPR